MRTKFNMMLTLLLAFVVQITFAQEKTVTGVVTDADNIPLPGVSVSIKGKSLGTQTDFDGAYQITATASDVLVFDYLGFKKVEVNVGNQSEVNVSLQPDTEDLEEVVVTAYGSKKRDQLTSAVSVVGGEDLERMNPTTSVDNMLQGMASGVSVTAGNGKPGQTAFVRIRGVGSINASSAPLYIIDGVVAPNLNTVSPADIESMSVLKDAATASIYGSRAANGVIVITTKQGSRKKGAQISYSSQLGFTQRNEDNFRMMNTAEKIQYERELASIGVSAAAGLPGATLGSQEDYQRLLDRGGDWQDILLKRGVIQSNRLSAQGGGEDFTYFLSMAHDRETGIIEDINGFERMNARLNITYDAKDWLQIGTNVSVTNTRSEEPRDRNNVQNPFRAMYDYNPYEPQFLLDNNNDFVLDANGERQFNPTRAGFSISEALINNPERVYRTVIIGGLNVNADITDKLRNEFRVGATNTRFRRTYFVKPGSILDNFVGDAANPGSKTDNGSENLDYTITNILSYRETINDVHNFKISALYEFNHTIFRNYLLRSIGFASPDLSVQAVAAEPTAASTNLIETTLQSFGGFLDYDYNGKYIATASLRRDESSVFGLDNQDGIFYSASAAWNIHREDFMEDSGFSNLKLRSSYGTSGNRAGIGAYQAQPAIGFGSFNGLTTAIPTSVGNPILTFEKNIVFDVGVEFGLFQNRLRGVVDYFHRTTSDLILARPTSSMGGVPGGSIDSNIGEMVNKGVEIELSGDVIVKDDFTLTLGGNITFINNEVTGLVPSANNPDGDPINRGFTTVAVGEELNTFRMPRWAGVNPANGQPLFYDSNGNITNQYDGGANEILSGKSPIADFEGGFNIRAQYKNFDLQADFFFRYGHYIYNAMESNMLSDGQQVQSNQRVDAFNYWRNPGDTDVLPSPLYGVDAQQLTDRFLQKGDFIRLRNLTVGYTVPNSVLTKTGITRARLFLQGQNLWSFIPHFKGDPEVGISSGEAGGVLIPGQFNLYSYPIVQQVTFGIDVQF